MLPHIVAMVNSAVAKVQGYLPPKDMMFYSKFTEEEFIDQIDLEKQRDPERLQRISEAHYTLLFLFDLLQFCFQFLTQAKTVFKQLTEPKPIQEMSPEERMAQVKARNHRLPLDPINFQVDLSFYVENFEQLVGAVATGVEKICPDYMTLVNLWHIKDNSYFGANQLIDENERGQSYEREDAFNVIGLGCYIYLINVKPGAFGLQSRR